MGRGHRQDIRNRAWKRARLAATIAICAAVVGCTDTLEGWQASMRGARHYAAGSEALDRGDASAALVELREAARLVPHASEIRNHLGIAYWRAGDVVRARGAFEAAVELDCDNEAARRNLASLEAARAGQALE